MKSHMARSHLYEGLVELKRTVLQFLRHIENGGIDEYNFPVKNRKNLPDAS